MPGSDTRWETTLQRRPAEKRAIVGQKSIPLERRLKAAPLLRRSLETETIEPRFDDSTSWQLLRIARLSVLIAVTHDP